MPPRTEHQRDRYGVNHPSNGKEEEAQVLLQHTRHHTTQQERGKQHSPNCQGLSRGEQEDKSSRQGACHFNDSSQQNQYPRWYHHGTRILLSLVIPLLSLVAFLLSRITFCPLSRREFSIITKRNSHYHEVELLLSRSQNSVITRSNFYYHEVKLLLSRV